MRAALIRHEGALPELDEIDEPAGDLLDVLAAAQTPRRDIPRPRRDRRPVPRIR
jgi:hypothetical protein